MHTLIIYDSVYGNTEKIARAIGNSLQMHGQVELVRVGEVNPGMLVGIDLVVVGSPTQQFRATEAMRTFLKSLSPNQLKGMRVAAFDTRLTQEWINQRATLGFFEKIFGYAAERIAKELKQKGGNLVVAGEAFYVEGMEGPLVAGEEQHAGEWAQKLFA